MIDRNGALETARRSAIVEIARVEIGSTDARRYIAEAAPVYAPTDRPSWCGIFVRWVWRRAGLDVPDWRMGSSNLSSLRKTADPKPADLVMWRGDLGHQSLFVREENGIVVSIDGNTTANGVSGVVAEKRRPRAEVLAFYESPSPKAA